MFDGKVVMRTLFKPYNFDMNRHTIKRYCYDGVNDMTRATLPSPLSPVAVPSLNWREKLISQNPCFSVLWPGMINGRTGALKKRIPLS